MPALHILIVIDDTFWWGERIKIQFESFFPYAKFDICETESQSLKSFRKNHPAIVLVTQKLRHGSSLRLITAIRQTDSVVPIVFLGARPDRLKEAEDCGATVACDKGRFATNAEFTEEILRQVHLIA